MNSESNKLKAEIEQQSKDNSQYTQLERKYETLAKSKEALEGQLADYNLALDKVKGKFTNNIFQQFKDNFKLDSYINGSGRCPANGYSHG